MIINQFIIGCEIERTSLYKIEKGPNTLWEALSIGVTHQTELRYNESPKDMSTGIASIWTGYMQGQREKVEVIIIIILEEITDFGIKGDNMVSKSLVKRWRIGLWAMEREKTIIKNWMEVLYVKIGEIEDKIAIPQTQYWTRRVHYF